MARKVDPKVLRAYKDAVGILLATFRKDDDGVDQLIAEAASKAQLIVAIASVSELVMRELDRAGGDSEAMLRRWALNVYRAEAK